jgi:hypothetical protein
MDFMYKDAEIVAMADGARRRWNLRRKNAIRVFDERVVPVARGHSPGGLCLHEESGRVLLEGRISVAGTPTTIINAIASKTQFRFKAIRSKNLGF